MTDLLNGTGSYSDRRDSEHYAWWRNALTASGHLTWRDVLLDEVFKALATEDPEVLRAGLLQSAGVATAWAGAVERAGTGSR